MLKLLLFVVSAAMLVGGLYLLVDELLVAASSIFGVMTQGMFNFIFIAGVISALGAVAIIYKLIYDAPLDERDLIQHVGSSLPTGVIVGAILVAVPLVAIAGGMVWDCVRHRGFRYVVWPGHDCRWP